LGLPCGWAFGCNLHLDYTIYKLNSALRIEVKILFVFLYKKIETKSLARQLAGNALKLINAQIIIKILQTPLISRLTCFKSNKYGHLQTI
jgi:hypothetical protein